MSEWRRLVGSLVLGLLLLVGSGCQPFQRGPEEVSLAQLAARQEAYDGHQVRTRGAVRKLQDIAGPYYYVIEDADQHDAELQPGSSAADYEGRQVEVVGLFHFSERSEIHNDRSDGRHWNHQTLGLDVDSVWMVRYNWSCLS